MGKATRMIAGLIPPVKRLLDQRDELLAEVERLKVDCGSTAKLFPDGHFYSPIPDLDQIKQRHNSIFGVVDSLPGIDLNTDQQLSLLDEFVTYYADAPWKPEPMEGLRYYYENPNYSYSDGLCLYSMIRHCRPKKIVEIGSGFSSCVILDTNDRFFDNAIECTFIEPYPDLLKSLVKETDRIAIIPEKLQDVDIHLFSQLGENDILLIDSTHVSRVGSDVNMLLFEVLPSLQKGVYIHVHDIFYPFEYPANWVYEGRAWNEAYLLRAFLQYNDVFKIVLFKHYLHLYFERIFAEKMPLHLNNSGGNIWLYKTR